MIATRAVSLQSLEKVTVTPMSKNTTALHCSRFLSITVNNCNSKHNQEFIWTVVMFIGKDMTSLITLNKDGLGEHTEPCAHPSAKLQ